VRARVRARVRAALRTFGSFGALGQRHCASAAAAAIRPRGEGRRHEDATTGGNGGGHEARLARVGGGVRGRGRG
jgi:hypothetical protein